MTDLRERIARYLAPVWFEPAAYSSPGCRLATLKMADAILAIVRDHLTSAETEVERLQVLLREARAERDEARMKLSDMHRRAQAAEAAVYEKLPDPKTGPVTLGRMLATAAYHREAEAREKAEAERDAARALLAEAMDWMPAQWPGENGRKLIDLRARIDAALATRDRT